MDPRQMGAMMKRLGIDVRNLEDVEEVVVRAAGKEYVFSQPSVSIMKAQGTETWQVSGRPKERAVSGPGAGALAAGAGGEAGSSRTGHLEESPQGRDEDEGDEDEGDGGEGDGGQGDGRQGGGAGRAIGDAPGAAAAKGPPFTEEDVAMVVDTVRCSRDQARKALEETDGDIAEAILKLSP